MSSTAFWNMAPVVADTDDQLYQKAVADTLSIEPGELHSLQPLKFDGPIDNVTGTKTTKVVTFATKGYKANTAVTFSATDEVWVVGLAEIQAFLKEKTDQYTSEDELFKRLSQVLGLPFPNSYRQLVCLTINEQQVNMGKVFRPTPNPDPRHSSLCPTPNDFVCAITFSNTTSLDHKNWFRRNMLSYAGSVNKLSLFSHSAGYPWTRLGYTYDWYSDAHGNAVEFGLSEYVIRGQTTVQIGDVLDVLTFRSRSKNGPAIK